MLKTKVLEVYLFEKLKSQWIFHSIKSFVAKEKIGVS